MKMYDVIVVGCGAAGLAALTKTHQAGLSILGLEGSGRIGGRIKTVNFGDGKVDLGAEWCHGEDGNTVYEIVKDMNVLEAPTGVYNPSFMKSDGGVIPMNVCSKITDLCVMSVEQAKSKIVNDNRSLGEYITEEFHDLFRETKALEPYLEDMILEWFQKYENSIEASETWFDPSAIGYLEYWECPGNSQLSWKGKGYETLINILLKKIPDPSQALDIPILFNKKVKLIDWTQNDHVGSVKVECDDGSEYIARHVIVTVSLGVLQQKYSSMFIPQLPEDKINAINGLSLGTVDKIFAQYTDRWWPDHSRWVGFLWHDQDKDNFPGTDAWLVDIFGFNTNDYNPKVMCFWITGATAKFMESLPIEMVEDGINRLVAYFFRKCSVNVPKLEKVLRSEWGTDPLFYGSYSFRSMESERLSATSSCLAAPVMAPSGSRPLLCFAGEATSTHYYSTVHGAVETGQREADRVIASSEKIKSEMLVRSRL